MKDKNENSINFQTPLNVVIMVVALLILPQTLLARGARDMDIDDWEQQSEQVREENRLGEESGDGEMLREQVREENRLGEESGDGEMLREEVREENRLREESGDGEQQRVEVREEARSREKDGEPSKGK